MKTSPAKKLAPAKRKTVPAAKVSPSPVKKDLTPVVPVEKKAPRPKRPNEIRYAEEVQRTKHPLMKDNRDWDREKVIAILCEKVSCSNMGMVRILRAGHDGMTLPDYLTVLRWITEDSPAGDEFRIQYARAKEQQAEFMAEELLEIADTARLGKRTKVNEDGTETVTADAVDRARLQVDARKWLMGKLKPKKYGDVTTLRGDPDSPLQLEVRSMIASSDELLAKMRGGKK